MPGRNRYLDVQQEYRNLNETFEKRASGKPENFSMGSSKPTEPCIFLSHRSTEKAAVVEIGNYIMSRGIDVYIDINDENLQRAVAKGEHKAITAAIELGIANSTDLLAYITLNTAKSPWVPYEIGFAKRNQNNLALMRGKDLPAFQLPSYLEIVDTKIGGRRSLNNYLIEVLKRTSGSLSGATAVYSQRLALLDPNAGLSLSAYLANE
jgi:hypothetical protein